MFFSMFLISGCLAPDEPHPGASDTAAASEAAWPARTCEEAPNFLLMVLDDVATDKIEAYQQHPDPVPTPTLDRLARQGVLFQNAWTAPVCSPARGLLLTGRYGRRYGLGRNVDQTGYVLPDEEETVAELLQGSPCGYTSVALGKWHLADAKLGDVPLDAPLRQGFAHHRGTLANLSTQRLVRNSEIKGDYFRWEDLHDGVLSLREGYATSATVDDTISMIAQLPEPWLSYVAFHAPHAPWQPPPPHLNPAQVEVADSDADRYDATLRALDLEIGRLLDSLDPAVLARTVIFVIGDNGTPEDVLREPTPAHSAKNSLFEGGIRVPLIVAGPEIAQPGVASSALVHVTDLFPTIAELALATPRHTIDGASLLPILRDPAVAGRPYLFVERFRPNGPYPWGSTEEYALRNERFKLLWDPLDGIEQLFDLQDSPYDGADLLADGVSSEEAAILDVFRQELDDLLGSVPPLSGPAR